MVGKVHAGIRANPQMPARWRRAPSISCWIHSAGCNGAADTPRRLMAQTDRDAAGPPDHAPLAGHATGPTWPGGIAVCKPDPACRIALVSLLRVRVMPELSQRSAPGTISARDAVARALSAIATPSA